MTALFETIPIFEQPKRQAARTVKQPKIMAQTLARPDKIVGLEIKRGYQTHYATGAEWSTHDLMAYALDVIGEPAEVKIVTWSVGEDAVRILSKLAADGKITRVECIFDWRVKVRRPEVHAFARQAFARVRLSSTHAKMVLINSKSWKISIITSANLTNNPRIEAGVIDTSNEVFEFHEGWFNSEMAGASPFFSERKR